MKRLLLISLMLLAFSAVLLPVVAAAQDDTQAVIESISYEKDNENLETITFKLNGAHIPKVFKIKGEKPRLVFDFIDTRYSDLINNIINTEGNLIKGVRVGIHNDPPKTRVVVDLKPEEKFKFEQDFLLPENALTITFFPDELSAAEAGQESQSKTVTEAEKKESMPPVSPQSGKEVVTEQPQSAASDDQPAVAEPEAEEGGTTAVQEPEAADSDNVPDAVKGQPKESGEQGSEVNPILAQITAEEEEPVDPILRDISFETSANKSEMVMFKLNDFYPPIVFGIEKGNPRVVCDFLDTAMGGNIRPVINTDGNYVSRIRTARHNDPDKIRIVLDLVPNRNYDLQQVFFKEENLFVIIISQFEEEPVPSVDIPTIPQG